MNFINTLSGWQWTLMALVPPAIFALYFLKLKREPLEVPSTYLWRKSLEDLHVNSLWQRLRRSLLLLLQLLLILLAMLALTRPGWRGNKLVGPRFIFMIDQSASMSATDVKPSRLAEAKRRTFELIDQMDSHSQAMIVAFSDHGHVVQNYTDNRRKLREQLEELQPTQRRTAALDALQLAAGLANPGRVSVAVGGEDIPVDAMPADLYLFSDGKFETLEGFALGNLKPFYIRMGDSAVRNVAITNFDARQHESRPGQWQAFAQLTNYGPESVKVTLEFYLEDGNGERLVDATQTELAGADNAGPKTSGIATELGEVESGWLRLELDHDDALTVDNVAYATINPPRRSRVLLVTPGNMLLEPAVRTSKAQDIADVEVAGPEVLATKTYQEHIAASRYDLIIYDRCGPKQMPQANTFWIGRLPPRSDWPATQSDEKVGGPQILDTNRTHPIMHLIELGDLLIAESLIAQRPPAGTVLIDSDLGPLCVVAPREGFEDVVLGFELISTSGAGESFQNTTWVTSLSFPTFFLNVLRYLGGNPYAQGSTTIKPGQPVQIASQAPVDQLMVVTPDGTREPVRRGKRNLFSFHNTDTLGVYDVQEDGQVSQRFAVNLFDSRESDIRPREKVEIGYTDVEGQANWEPARRETWKGLLLLALAVLLFEWYTYNRRMYI